MGSKRWAVACMLTAAALFLPVPEVQAVPSFARQTGMDCTTCHMSWLELTNVGRRFKLGGYQLMKAMPEDAERPLVTFNFEDNPPLIPLAAWAQVSLTNTKDTSSAGTSSSDYPQNNSVILQAASLFLAGKIIDYVGCFCQWTYDGTVHHSALDNTEIRVADSYDGDDFGALYGLSFNNAPTMSDIYNTTPVWGWPYISSFVAQAPAANTIINGTLSQQVAGLTAYTLLDKKVYLEYGGYRAAQGGLSFMGAGTQRVNVVDGTAPYYRAALQYEWDKGKQSGEIGAYGLKPSIFPDYTMPYGATDTYTDNAYDLQYQYITDANRFSFMYTYIHEKQNLGASYAAGISANPNNTLNQINTKVSYYYEKWYGVSLGYQQITGSADQGLYNTGQPITGSANGSPNSAAWIGELDWLFSPTGAQDHRKYRLVLQYTAYTKFNGARTNYDGFGRNASGNNTLFLGGWFYL